MGNKIRTAGLLLAFLFGTLCATPSFASGKESSSDSLTTRAAQQYVLLNSALQQYQSIKDKGGWKKIRATQKFYQKGQSAAAVKDIKKRLQMTGEFSADDTSTHFTAELEAAVKKVQRRYGHRENGVVNAQLVKELNRTVDERIRQLEVNLARYAASTPVSSGIRLVANIPEFKLHVYEGDQHVFDMNIVVGSESNKTVIFDDEMTHVVFSPYWNVPPSIVKNEILPAMRRSSSYLRRNGYEQTGTENGLPVIRQKPGSKNSLGLVKFVFPNDNNIYFHDTPAKGLFELPKRAFSHGCIRLAEPAKLAAYLLRNEGSWSEDQISKAMHGGKEQWVKLSTPVAVSLTYYTAWVDDAGMVHFREDIYGKDGVVNSEW